MWIFTTKGFISVVEDRDDKRFLLVRGRRKSAVMRVVEDEERIVVTTDSDYPYRAWVSRRAFSDWLTKQADDINYANFKSAAEDDGADMDQLQALHEVWRVMRETEPPAIKKARAALVVARRRKRNQK